MLVPERHPSLMQADYRTTPKYQRRWLTLVVLSLSLVIIGMDNTILNVAIPTLQRDLAASASRLQWMVDSYILVFAGLLLVMGALGDRYGRASALRAGLLIFLVASLGAAYSRSSGQLIAARAVLGIGGALIMPATLSIITDIFPREERGRAIGIWAGVAGLGIGLGPLVGGFLLEHFWWGSVFLVNIPVVLIALALGPALVPQSRDSQPRPLDIPGAVLSIAAVATFVYTVIEAPARGWTDPIIMGGFVLTIVLGIGFARRELTTPHPMLPFDFFKNPRFTAGAGAISIAFFCLFGMIFGLTQYLQFVHGYSPFEAGLRTAPIALGMMIGSTNSHRWVRKFGTTRVVAAALLGVASLLTVILFWTSGTPYWIILLTMIGYSFSMSNAMAPSTDAVMGAVPVNRAGVGSAVNDVTRQVGGAIGVAVIGSIINSIYANKMAPAVAGLPQQAADAARDSIGAALTIANTLPPQVGDPLRQAAAQSFTDAFGLALLAGVGIAIAGAILVLRFMPPRHLPVAGQPDIAPASTPLSQGDPPHAR